MIDTLAFTTYLDLVPGVRAHFTKAQLKGWDDDLIARILWEARAAALPSAITRIQKDIDIIAEAGV